MNLDRNYNSKLKIKIFLIDDSIKCIFTVVKKRTFRLKNIFF